MHVQNMQKTCCVQKLLRMSKQFLYTICSLHVLSCNFHEQSVVILWVNWFKNECFWHRFTCTWLIIPFFSKKIPWHWTQNLLNNWFRRQDIFFESTAIHKVIYMNCQICLFHGAWRSRYHWTVIDSRQQKMDQMADFPFLLAS